MVNWSIAKRINLIALSLIGALVVVGALGVFATLRLSALLDDYASSGKQVLLATDIAEDLFEANIAQTAYRRASTVENSDEVQQNLDEVLEAKDEIATAFADHPETLRLAEMLSDDVREYLRWFEEAKGQQAEREVQVQGFVNYSADVLQATRNTLNLLLFDNNLRARTGLEDMLLEFMQSRVFVERYLLTNVPEDFVTATEHYDRAMRRINDSVQAIENPERQAAAEEVQALLQTYWTFALGARDAIELRNVIQLELDRIGSKMVDNNEQIVVTAAANQNEIAASAQRISLLVLAVLIGFLAAAVVGCLIVSRRVSGTIVTAVDTSIAEMRTLADGDLETEISGTEDQNEFGDIARALVVFRDNTAAARAAEARQREAEDAARRKADEDARREARAEEERQAKIEAARQAMITDLATSVGVAVQAGARGDFSQRVTTDFTEAELQDLARSINTMLDNVEQGVAATAQVVARMATGDLSERMQGDFPGAFSDLQSDVNGSLETLSQLIMDIAGQCDGVSSEAGAMNRQSEELARRAEQQAASLEETSAAMEEISASAKSSAEGATEAASFANAASTQVDDAGKVVSSAVEAMADIRDASDRIGEIVSVIDGIAFQTNLLALNASVEAARAGSAGKGFAVVATEVRALAQRSSEASQDIKTLIEESSTQVRRGVDLVEETGRTLDEIMGGVRKMAATMQELTTTAREQATGVGEVTSAISQLDVITQKNAALSEESRENASRLGQQADHMRDLLQTFQTHPSGYSGERTAIAAA
ncbi:MAG: methyl-accepting chemotaxis protein [Pseudomonadota bacterium]